MDLSQNLALTMRYKFLPDESFACSAIISSDSWAHPLARRFCNVSISTFSDTPLPDKLNRRLSEQFLQVYFQSVLCTNTPALLWTVTLPGIQSGFMFRYHISIFFSSLATAFRAQVYSAVVHDLLLDLLSSCFRNDDKIFMRRGIWMFSIFTAVHIFAQVY